VPLIVLVYLISAILLAAYGFNPLLMAVLYLRHRHRAQPRPELTEFPVVTVQLPIYNERYVVERLIDAVVRLDYPLNRLEIQVLDDSTDGTTAIARAQVERYRTQGFDIRLLHRAHRQGFKAGALREGLFRARGELIAIFDADFVPQPDFLQATVPYFLADPHLGMVQTRWGHINEEYSWLTRAQALGMDGHFVVEQTARNRAGLLMNFNGTAGVWRRMCIEEAGGWQEDTLAEDLDLSYRAQLGGWRFLFLPQVVSPAELPPQIHAFKVQQFRWAKGSIQCAVKLWRRLLAAPFPLFVKVQGLLHLTNYLVHPLMIILLLTAIPLIPVRSPYLAYLTCLSVVTVGPPIMYALSQWAITPDWRRRLARLPWLVLLGTGIALNNALAIYEALTGRESPFKRTPKFRIEGVGDRWADKSYALPFSPLALGELALALYAGCGVFIALARGNTFVIPYLMLYALGFGYVSLLTIAHSMPRWGRRRAIRSPLVARIMLGLVLLQLVVGAVRDTLSGR
jgi:cellulose synthase/poly-beta-1,6-N-acetylglucosamine synthase-like glycosyltransferase